MAQGGPFSVSVNGFKLKLNFKVWEFDASRGEKFEVYDRNNNGRKIKGVTACSPSVGEFEQIVFDEDGLPVLADSETDEPKTRLRKGSIVAVRIESHQLQVKPKVEDDIPF